MHIKRKIHKRNSIYWMLLCAVLLRSFIAPGYALTFDSNSPLGLGMILCQGINEIEFFDDSHGGHDHHPATPAMTTGADAVGKPGTGMTAADSCCWWTTGSQFVYISCINPAPYIQADGSWFQHSLPVIPFTRYAIQPQQPRAPPQSPLV